MNWQDYIDQTVGDKKTYTNDEVRAMVRKTMEYVTDCWLHQSR